VIELVDGSWDTAAAARIRGLVFRWLTFDPETIEHFRATRPGFRDWVALLDGESVGTGACGLLLAEAESSAAFAVNCVLPEARGRGVGSAIYRRVSAHARSLEKSELVTFGFEDEPAGLAFAERRGFVVSARVRALQLLLEGCPRPFVELPAEVEMTTLAEHPDLARGVWETAQETFPDIPYDSDAPFDPGSYETFVERDLSGPATSRMQRLSPFIVAK
jgi:GNAT superfamily N-acetyltransferase